MEDWVENDTCIDGLEQVRVHQLYRAMGFLIENNERLQERVFFSTANLLNLEVDFIYFDTTSTYFEVEPGFGEEEELRKAGHSKDHRPDLLQVVIGLAVTRDGIPVRCWVWPGNTVDMEVIADVKRDLAQLPHSCDKRPVQLGRRAKTSRYVLDHVLIGVMMVCGRPKAS